MSRLASLSPDALRALFSPDADDNLIVLITLSGSNLTAPLRYADGYTVRLAESDTDVVYGVVSRGENFVFLPFNLALPTEDESAPHCQINLNDPTRVLVPMIRTMTTSPTVKIELVLMTSPDTVEVDLGEFLLADINYVSDSISGELTLESFEMEPFPSGTFTPSYFQGLF